MNEWMNEAMNEANLFVRTEQILSVAVERPTLKTF